MKLREARVTLTTDTHIPEFRGLVGRRGDNVIRVGGEDGVPDPPLVLRLEWSGTMGSPTPESRGSKTKIRGKGAIGGLPVWERSPCCRVSKQAETKKNKLNELVQLSTAAYFCTPKISVGDATSRSAPPAADCPKMVWSWLGLVSSSLVHPFMPHGRPVVFVHGIKINIFANKEEYR